MSILLTFLLAFFPAFAQNTADEAELNFQLARDAYQQGEFETALFHFMVSNRLSPNRNVTFNIGRTYHALRRYPEAYRWYYDALHAEEPTSERVLAQIQESLDRLRPQVALLRVTTDPPGATVYLRRKNLGAVGVTPLEVPLDPSSYNVIVELEGYEDVETDSFDLSRRGSIKDVSLTLVQIVGQVAVTGQPGATVHVNSEDSPPLCEVPCTADVPVGRQILYFKKPGFRSLPSLVEVSRGQMLEVNAELLPITGTVVIDAEERGALIEVDGVPAGYTPAVLSDVQVGEHTVRVSARGYDAVEMPIQVLEDETVDLGRVMMNPRLSVTAASRFAEEVSQAPASVTIIPKEEIRAFGYQTAMEALLGSRGVYATNDLVYESLGVRGFSRVGDYGNRVLVTVDGHVMNDAVYGSSYFTTDFLTDMQDVEQIELVRGPGSALYGSNAVFGVVNFVTNSDADEPYRSHAAVSTVDGMIRARVGVGARGNNSGIWASLSGVYGPGKSYFFREYEDLPSGGISQDADETYGRTIALKAWAGNFTLQGTYTGREKEQPNGAFGINLGDHRNSVNDYRGFLEARYLGGSETTKLDARIFVDHYSNLWLGPYGSGIFVDDFDATWIGARAQLNQDIGDNLSLTLGGDTRQAFDLSLKTYELERVGDEGVPGPDDLNLDAPYQIYSGYGVLDLHPGDLIRLNAGVRVDQYAFTVIEDDDVPSITAVNPRGAIILSPGRDVVKLVAGTAFRAPSEYERSYSDGEISSTAARNLDPENSWTTDLEWTHEFSDVLTTAVNGYYSRIDDLIDLDEYPEDPSLVQFQNTAGAVQTVGAEAEIRRWWRGGWMFAGQVSWQRTRVGDLVDGEELTNSPMVLGALMGAAPLGPQVTLATKIRGETPRLTRAGRLTDGAVSWDVTLTGQLERPNIEFGLGVRNLLDWPVYHPGGADLTIDSLPQPGRNFFGSLRVDF